MFSSCFAETASRRLKSYFGLTLSPQALIPVKLTVSSKTYSVLASSQIRLRRICSYATVRFLLIYFLSLKKQKHLKNLFVFAKFLRIFVICLNP